MNSHYVPRLILKRFSEKLCVYNIKTGELKEDVKIEHTYAESDFYDAQTEENFNKKVESQFGNLLANKLLKCKNTVELSHKELNLIKKFLLLSVLRSNGGDAFVQREKNFYKTLRENVISMWRADKMSEAEIAERVKSVEPPFEEKQVIGESSHEYWLRTLNVVLDTDGSSDEILKHRDKTYMAYRWAQVIESGYLAFWDTDSKNDEFLITDIGMTSENEKGWNGVTVGNHTKMDFYLNLASRESDPYFRQVLARYMGMNTHFHENFQMFPISAKRMIVLIAPFYKFRRELAYRYQMPSLDYLTCLTNENLYEPNTVEYYLEQPTDSIKWVYHEKDKYIYQIKKLNGEEVRYCNALFMDRVHTYLGFSSLNKAVRSVVLYKRLNEYPYIPRVDYTNLYKIIEKRYLGSLNI